MPLAGLPVGTASLIFFAVQLVAVFAATWLAVRVGGAAGNLETFAWSAVATTFFLPVFATLWMGNVSGFLAFAVAVAAVGGIAAGAAAFAATLLKTTPVLLIVPVVFAGRRSLLGLLLVVPVLVTSFVLAPYAWFDFLRVIPNLLSGPAHFENNLALHSLVTYALPGLPWAADLARAVSVGGGLAALAASVVLARRRVGWPAALTLAVAALLLLPSATWYHYFAMLLPLAALAWPRAGRARAPACWRAVRRYLRSRRLPVTVVGAALMLAPRWSPSGRAGKRRMTALSARLSAGVPSGVRDFLADPARRRLISLPSARWATASASPRSSPRSPTTAATATTHRPTGWPARTCCTASRCTATSRSTPSARTSTRPSLPS